MTYSISVLNNTYEVSLSRTGGQGSKGDSVSSVYVGVNNHLFIVISDGAGNVIEEYDAGDINANIQVAIDDLSDVSINFLGEDYFLGYNSTANRWESKTISVGDLSDVTISSIADNDLLAWDAGALKFNNQSPAEAGFATVATSGSYNDLSSKPASANNSIITLATSGNGFSGGGTFTLDQAAASTITHTFDQTALSITESQISDLQAYLTAEADTLSTVMVRGASTPNSMLITNANTSVTDDSGALVVTGGVGIGENLNVGGNAIISGNLIINGTTTTVNSNEVNIGDAVILLNSDEVGTPSQNAGFEIERGTLANVSFVWDESTDAWSMGGYELQDVIIDGGTY
jgi:hypothetical protein